VFAPQPDKSCCNIHYEINAIPLEKEWHTNEPAVEALTSVDIFDSECGKFYLSTENEASYTPMVVALFDELVHACEGVKERLQTDKASIPNKLPDIPF